MSRITGSQAKSLVEAYQSIYNIQEQVSEDDLALEIFEEVAYALISQGHTAVDVLEYFANVNEEVIIEDLIALSEGTLIVESVVSEEYIEEQMQQLYENPLLGLAARAVAPAARLASKLAPKVAGAVTKFGQKAANVAWRGTPTSAKKLLPAAGTKSAAPAVVKPNLIQRAGSAVSGAVGKVKDAARGALNKLPGGSGGKLASGLKTAGKWALGGAAFEGGMRAVQGLTGGKGPDAAKTAPSGDKAKYNASAALGGKTAFAAGGGAAAMKKDPKLTAADIQKRGNEALFKAGGGKAAMGGKTRAQVMAQGSKNVAAKPSATPPSKPASTTPAPAQPKVSPSKPAPSPAGQTGNKAKDTATWAKANPKLAAAAAERERTRGTSATTNPLMGDMKDKLPAPKPPVKAVTPDQSVAAASKPVDDITPAQSKIASSSRPRTRAQVLGQSYEYDAYDLVLEYLINNGHAETVEEAHYLMIEMDAEVIQNIVEEERTT